MLAGSLLLGGLPAAGQGPSPAADSQEPLPPGTILIGKEQTGDYRPQVSPDLTKAALAITRRTNEFRKESKKGPVTVDPQLQKTAELFAGYMARTGRYGHEADGQHPADRATLQGYEFCLIEENIAMQFKSNGFSTGQLTKAFFQGWKNSPPHRANMLHEAVTGTGIAIAQSEETGAFFAVQMFGRPRSEAIHFDIANRIDRPVHYRVGDDSYELPAQTVRRHVLCLPRPIVFESEGLGEQSIPPGNDEHFAIDQTDGKAMLSKVDAAEP
jgi:uncharacterized protein YkwD